MKKMILLALLVLSGCTPKTEEGNGSQYLYGGIVCEMGTYNESALKRTSSGGVYVNHAGQIVCVRVLLKSRNQIRKNC